MRSGLLKPFVSLFLMLQLAGLAAAQQDATPAVPGKLVDLGGFKVHIYCIGHGGPAVILLHGLGDYSFDWALVQPAVGHQAETCAYDRPGQGWSEPGPSPRGVTTSANELHTLLLRSGVKGPYILVGHSWGGLIARMYAHEYPKEVAGMVLVDSTHEDQYLWINGKIIRPKFMTDGEWADLRRPKKAAPATPSGDPTEPEAVARRPRVTQLPPPYDKLPADSQKLQLWAISLPWTKARDDGGDTQDLRQDFIAMSKVTLQSEHPLGIIPMIVLSRTPGIDDDEDYTPDQLKWNRDLQDQLAKLSTNSEHVVADHSGHHIQLDEPSDVITATLRVVDAVKYKRMLRSEQSRAH